MNKTIKKPERPDKPLFLAMMGAFFLCFAVAPAYWAFHNYGEIDRTKELLRRWRQQPETIPKDSYGGNPVAIQESKASRYQLEMILSAAGSFVLGGIALLLFVKAFTGRNRKNFYEKIDPRTIPVPPAPIKIIYKNSYGILFWAILIVFGAAFLLLAYQSFTNRFITTENAVMRTALLGVPFFIFLAVFLFVMIRARRNGVRLLDNSGVTRGDGRHFSWNDFCGVIAQMAFNQRTQRRFLWRSELAFCDGETVWIIPNRIRNYDEVSAYLDALPRAVFRDAK